MSITSCDCKMINIAINVAKESPVLMKHGCVAYKNGRVIASGFNNYRTYSKEGIISNTCSCHAECCVLHKIISKNLVKKLSKVKFCVVRIGQNDELRESAPCIDCYNLLNKYGVKNLIYSCDNGEIKKTKIKDYVATKITTGRSFINRINNKENQEID